MGERGRGCHNVPLFHQYVNRLGKSRHPPPPPPPPPPPHADSRTKTTSLSKPKLAPLLAPCSQAISAPSHLHYSAPSHLHYKPAPYHLHYTAHNSVPSTSSLSNLIKKSLNVRKPSRRSHTSSAHPIRCPTPQRFLVANYQFHNNIIHSSLFRIFLSK